MKTQFAQSQGDLRNQFEDIRIHLNKIYDKLDMVEGNLKKVEDKLKNPYEGK
jgi:hypothetical protein